MLKKINSIYFLEDVFSYLKEALILKIIKYNEDFQNKLDRNINNYRIYSSGKYILFDQNRKGKEYNYNGDLLFEGEYLKGKRGKGKEYDGKLLFEREYKNGKRNGPGK